MTINDPIHDPIQVTPLAVAMFLVKCCFNTCGNKFVCKQIPIPEMKLCFNVYVLQQV